MLLLIPVKFEKRRGASNVIPGTASITQETKLVIILFGNISPAHVQEPANLEISAILTITFAVPYTSVIKDHK